MTTSLAELWLPIIISSVVVFVLFMAFWTVAPHHKPEFRSLGKDNEDKLIDLVKSAGVKPGVYMYPHCGADKQYARSEEFRKKWEGGCMGILTLFPGAPNMARNMGLSMVVYLLVSVFVAYLSGLALAPGAEGMQVMQVAGTAAVGFYAFGSLNGGIWFGAPTRTFITNGFDAVVCGLVTGLIFMLLWPSAEVAANGAIPTP
ncbi:MAG: hypothetical protein H6814_04230 [Phycisphaeraceae bacterium]|nr:hypothetical protein [Phycisphaeraceae bacterium]